MDGARVKSYAKLNLTLAVTGAHGGYHDIDSLVCSVDLFDVIRLRKRKDDRVFVEMRGLGSECISYENNVAVKAAERYISRFGTRGVDITVLKNIPMRAGLGGSSADAAGVLRGMSALYGCGSYAQIKEIADGLGSDTGYMLTGGFARLTGRGERIEGIESAARLNFLLLLPKEGVSTAECYALCDGYEKNLNCTDSAIEALRAGDLNALGERVFNDLYPAAARLNGDVEKAYRELESFSPLGVCMTGSGCGVFALFENAEFCEWAKSRYRGKFTCVRLASHIPKN